MNQDFCFTVNLSIDEKKEFKKKIENRLYVYWKLSNQNDNIECGIFNKKLKNCHLNRGRFNLKIPVWM